MVSLHAWLIALLYEWQCRTSPRTGMLAARRCRKRLRYGPIVRYVKLRVMHAPGMPGTFSPPPRVSDPNMHHGTCVTHVPWCIPGLIASGSLWSRWRGKCSGHFRRMRIPQFYVSGKGPILRVSQLSMRAFATQLDSARDNQSQMASISQTTHSSAFSWMKMLELRLKFTEVYSGCFVFRKIASELMPTLIQSYSFKLRRIMLMYCMWLTDGIASRMIDCIDLCMTVSSISSSNWHAGR